jgi:hypothetical protein
LALIDRSIGRRRFLKGAAALAGGVALAPAFQGLNLLGLNGRASAAPGDGGYGPLEPVADLRDGVARLALPKGFQYRSFSVSGETMSDGNKVPYAHDGMASLNMPDGTIRLVRNHEDRNAAASMNKSVGGPAGTKYDALGGGGTTTLVIDPESRELVEHFVSLNGTIVNCAGGITPWGSWLTCEETNAGTPQGWTMQHGYAFDVPFAADATVPAVALPALGRFAHEAIAVDPATWIVYETEDSGDNSGFYRFAADTKGDLTSGKLQMLAVEGAPRYEARSGQTLGKRLPVTWVDIPDPNPPGQTSTAVFNQGFNAGGARFRRLEGCWYGESSIFFCSTNGGNAGAGQVWQYRPDGRGKGWLQLIYESPGSAVLDAPDNLVVSPRGTVLLCEDGGGVQYLRGVTQEGGIFDFALNLWNEEEWAGATFALHGQGPTRGEGGNPAQDVDDRLLGQHCTLFVNLFGISSGPNPPAAGLESMTVAIWGPWKDGAL